MPKTQRLSAPAAVVTGAGRGIGRGIVLALVREGFDVVGIDLVFEPGNRKAGLFEVKARVEELGGRFLPVAGDISRIDDHDRLLDAAVGVCGRIDLLVNNAGVSPLKRVDVLETSPESYDRLLAVNARGPFFLTQNAARRMAAQKPRRSRPGPAIVFITSISAAVSSTSRAEYCVSKAALSMTATVFADALAPKGIAVYEVRPGVIATDMTAGVKDKYDRLIAGGLVPQGRWGAPGDVGRAVAALARGDFGYSTGAAIEVSGGMNIRRL
ncbi:MAG TPA: 3-ketoacyl-ACP reductase [Candidatus Aminicenantes bacterium]|nr:3-ketoacyl-ACP reductase [Candidatus Aminicenantes bacterium]HRY65802.1 3-ketoacyl-ACP reductase [Candidatus Aminicenantes bacterium]HRZ72716.1 3-ketoacyl-ACP reductase [Candidatus Aminicenantes bacterium]